MPVIIRIILQRLIAFVIAFFAFLGISPEATIPTAEDIEFRTAEQRRLIDNILQIRIPEPEYSIENTEDIINIRDINLIPNIRNRETETDTHNDVEDVEITNIPVEHPVPQITEQSEIEFSESETINEKDLFEYPSEMRDISDVLVNIICSQRQNNMTTVSTGSGVIVSHSGIVLTNAHVAQFFALEGSRHNIECSLYKENIPTFGYNAEIIYIPPIWFSDNPTTISDPNPRGTGENDFAFLRITKNTNPVLNLPDRFPFARINLNAGIYEIGQQITIAGFPGSPASLFDLTRAGNLIIDINRIQDIFTFRLRNEIDIFSTYITPVAARGASGGGIFYDNDLIGITVTISREGSGSKINAITTTYINNILLRDLGKSINNLISNTQSNQILNFQNNVLPNITNQLSDQLN